MSDKSLPSHWATRTFPRGSQAFSEAVQRVESEPLHVRRARQKQMAQAAAEKARESGAFQVSREAGDGLAFFATSPTRASDRHPPVPNAEEIQRIEFTALEARVARMSKAVKFAVRAHKAALPDWPQVFIRLSHRPGEKPEPKDVSRLLDCWRVWLRRKWGCKTFRHVWVAELQGDRARAGDPGAVHYHVAIWVPPAVMREARKKPWLWSRSKGAHVFPKPDRNGWWKKGSTNVQWVKKSVVAYLAKYMSKGFEGGSFAKGQRIHGSGGFDVNQRVARAHWMLPAWLREQVTVQDRCKRLPSGVWVYPDGTRECGGGWVTESGETFRSPWRVVSFGFRVKIERAMPCNAVTAPKFESAMPLAA